MLNNLARVMLSSPLTDEQSLINQDFSFDPNSPRLRLIAGDASDRKFYRCRIAERSFICMVFPSWKGGYGGDPLSWIGMYKALHHWSLPVPEMVHIDEASSCIWTEDLGDTFLSDNLGNSPLDMLNNNHQETLSRYRKALRLIVDLQYPKHDADFAHPAADRPFDAQKLFYELNFFAENFLQGILETTANPKLIEEWTDLAEILGSSERILCHRDYHSRNIMISGGEPVWIDFQDARMGPHLYDVVSLLRDSYVRIEKHTRDSLFTEYFETLNNARRRVKLPLFSAADIYRERLLMGLQRNLKAIGSFGYLASKKNKRSYLSYVQHTLAVILEESAASELSIRYPATLELVESLHHGPLSQSFQKVMTHLGLEHF